MDDGVIEISLQKQKKGEPWSAVFVGHGKLNPLVEQQVRSLFCVVQEDWASRAN